MEIRRVLRCGGMLLLVNETYRDPNVADVVDFMVEVGKMAVLSPAEQEASLVQSGFEEVDISTFPDQNWITAVARVS